MRECCDVIIYQHIDGLRTVLACPACGSPSRASQIVLSQIQLIRLQTDFIVKCYPLVSAAHVRNIVSALCGITHVYYHARETVGARARGRPVLVDSLRVPELDKVAVLGALAGGGVVVEAEKVELEGRRESVEHVAALHAPLHAAYAAMVAVLAFENFYRAEMADAFHQRLVARLNLQMKILMKEHVNLQ